jgi:hypothetical protein
MICGEVKFIEESCCHPALPITAGRFPITLPLCGSHPLQILRRFLAARIVTDVSGQLSATHTK